jgi:Holliday junction resolvase RusA-like endonuclease
MPAPFVVVTLLGAPRGKGRPRVGTIGGFARVFTDKKTRAYEDALKAEGIKAMGDRPYLDEALSVMIRAYMPVPESWSARKRAMALHGDIMPTGAPDFDNICKLLDGLNYHPPRFKGDKEKRPIIWRNDSQIVSAHVMKFYDGIPRLEISVYRWFQ